MIHEVGTRPPSAGPTALPLFSRQDWCWEWTRSYTGDSTPIESSETLLFRGPLDTGALRDTLAEIGTRHEALRLHLVAGAGPDPSAVWPGQGLRPEPGPLEVVRAAPGERAAEVTRILSRPLDLTDRMTRTTLVRTAEEEHVLVAQFHHLIFDSTSHRLFRDLLADGYRERVAPEDGIAKRRGEHASYTGLISREHAPEVRSAVHGRAAALAEELRAYGAADPLAGDTGAVVAEAEFGSLPVALTAERTRLLLRRSRAERVTLHTVLLAALGHAVATVYERNRLVCSVYTHGRTSASARETLGLFSTVVPVPVDTGYRSLTEFLKAVHSSVQRASGSADLPFSEIASRVLDRPPGEGAYYRSALAHLELRLSGVTGWLPEEPNPVPTMPSGLAVIPQDLHPEHPFPVFAGPEQALACASTLFADLEIADGALTGSLWYEKHYHDATRAARVGEIFMHFIERLSEGGSP
ncbi:condensation domain-containing protein [Streptomyces sp. 303MFCol5.2]|uniref:condensation domain-containing protein n=1 Tax=Streptomyces sp. 303MFCol5.2 TaxID=1172181 RepID=UPI00035C5CD9|nr:condensation domain-containing protein [Streptomyces sp. 303MFCol5.2]